MSGIKEALYKKFEDIPSRRGRGGTYQYIRWQDVADRMNDVFGARWSSEVVYQDIVGKNIIIRVSVCIKDPDTGERFCQEGYGGAVNDDSQEAGNAFKAAYSKALKDACKKWGVGLYLEEDDVQETSSAIPNGFTGKEYGVPPKSEMPSMPPIELTPPEVEKKQVDHFVEKSEVINQIPTIPPAMPNQKESVDNTKGAGLPSIPPSFGSEKTTPVPSKYNSIKSDDISDVQKVALHSILKRLGVDYESLVKEAFEANKMDSSTIPGIDSLTYEQAVNVVRYGNNKFREQ